MTRKRQVSLHKYRRVCRNPKAIHCQAYRYKNNKYESEASVEAFKFGDYVYALFPRYVGENRFSVYCMRYWVGDHERSDLFAYVRTGYIF